VTRLEFQNCPLGGVQFQIETPAQEILAARKQQQQIPVFFNGMFTVHFL
jgi:hypothetical protein